MPAKKPATSAKNTSRAKKPTVKKESLADLSVRKSGPKGGYTPWGAGGLTGTRIVGKINP